MCDALVEQPIAAYSTPALRTKRICLRSFRSPFQLSSFFVTMEEEIPPKKNGRRKSIKAGSNEIDRWKIRWIEEEMDDIWRIYTYVYVQRIICYIVRTSLRVIRKNTQIILWTYVWCLGRAAHSGILYPSTSYWSNISPFFPLTFSIALFLCNDGRNNPTVEEWKKKIDQSRIEGENRWKIRWIEEEMDDIWRINTYVYVQRKICYIARTSLRVSRKNANIISTYLWCLGRAAHSGILHQVT